MKKKPDLKERVQAEIKKLIDKISVQQYRRAAIIDKALKEYERNVSLKVRCVKDYVDLIKTQRLLIGLENENVKTGGKFEIEFVTTGGKNEKRN